MTVMGMRGSGGWDARQGGAVLARVALDPRDHLLCDVATHVAAQLLDPRGGGDVDLGDPSTDEVQAHEDETVCREARRHVCNDGALFGGHFARLHAPSGVE